MESHSPERKKKQSAVIFALVVVAMFVGSMLVAMFYASSNPEEPDAPNNPGDQPPASGINFESQDFDSKVVDLLPELLILGDTKEAMPEKIEAEFAKVKGIKSINQAGYTSQEAGKLKYRASFSILQGYTASQVFESMSQNSTLLEEIQGIGSALVELPSEINVANSDLNLSKEFKPKSKIAKSFVSLDTLKGDLIKASLRVTLANDISSNLQVFESSNPNSEIKQFSEKTSAKVSSLDKKLMIQGKMDYSNYIDENLLKLQLNSQEFAINSLNSQEFGKSMTASVSGIDENYDLNLVKENLDSAAIQGLDSFELGKGSADFTIDIAFNQGADLNEMQKSISASLEELGFKKEQYSFQQPEAWFLIDLNLSTENSSNAMGFLQNLFDSKKISIEAKQPLNVELSTVFVQDLNSSLSIDGNSLQVMAKPNHSIGEEVSFTLNIIEQRGKILQAQGIEE